MTLGEFRKITKDLPDSTEIVARSDNFVLKGAIQKTYGAYTEPMRIVNKSVRDEFEGNTYSTPVYVPCNEYDENKKDVVRIY